MCPSARGDLSYAIGVDVGGTFTDLVLIDDEGGIRTGKVPSTPADQSVGVINGLEKMAGELGLSIEELLSRSTSIVHGTTVSTNLILELKGSVTGIITTKGFRDIIDIRRNYREKDFDLRFPAPDPLVPRRRRIGVTGRIDSSGQEVTPLSEAEVTAAVENLVAQGVEAIAVCYLFSFLNPEHEIQTREIINRIAPDVHVSLSHEVLPRVREFERVSTTAVDAFVTPKLQLYLTRLAEALRGKSFEGDVFVISANGGMLPIEQASSVGAQLVLSGPAGGVVAGAQATKKFDGPGNAITVDMGGTSYDICLIENGAPVVNTDAWMNRYRIAVPTLDVKTIGAGGGSIARADAAGGLNVGPESAGAVPGPACFGKGGTLPTVSDANLFLGFLDADAFLGGEMSLDKSLAEKAIEEHVAKPLGISTVEAAAGISVVVNNAMANGIREVSIARGHDPRDFTLIAFGGAGPTHASRQAKELGIKKVLVPREAPVLCALGDIQSDILVTKTRGMYARGSSLEAATVDSLVQEATDEALSEIGETENVTAITVEGFLEIHYLSQTHEILVPLDFTEVDGDGLVQRVKVSAENLQATIDRFHDIHERLYTFSKPGEETEIVGLRVDIRGHRPEHDIVFPEGTGADASEAVIQHRPVYMEEVKDFVESPIYDGMKLLPGHTFEGPAVVQERNTTIVVNVGDRVTILPDMTYELTVALNGDER